MGLSHCESDGKVPWFIRTKDSNTVKVVKIKATHGDSERENRQKAAEERQSLL